MPYAVLSYGPMNLSPETGRIDLAESLRLLDLAIEKDPNNTTAWLWRGIQYHDLGYFDRAVADFDECVSRDPAYLNCVQHRASVILDQGDTEAALEAFLPTVFENFHSMSDVFVQVLVDQGDSLAAVLLATAKLNHPYAPAGEWIKALQYPERDHRAGLARLDSWAAEIDYEYSNEIPAILLAFKAYERASQNPSLSFIVHSPSAKAFRQTPYFKQFIFNFGYEDYWRKNGFPPQCQLHQDQSYTCN
jgi:tetratricopeptide (TPR) repeat protein